MIQMKRIVYPMIQMKSIQVFATQPMQGRRVRDVCSVMIAFLVHQYYSNPTAIHLSSEQWQDYALQCVYTICPKSLSVILGLQNMAVSNEVIGVIDVLRPKWL